jgi:hypothetical protein
MLAALKSSTDVCLCGFQLSAALLDALFYGLQLRRHLLLGCLRLTVDFIQLLLSMLVSLIRRSSQN